MASATGNSTKLPRRKRYPFKRREIKNEFFIAARLEFSATRVYTSIHRYKVIIWFTVWLEHTSVNG